MDVVNKVVEKTRKSYLRKKSKSITGTPKDFYVKTYINYCGQIDLGFVKE